MLFLKQLSPCQAPDLSNKYTSVVSMAVYYSSPNKLKILVFYFFNLRGKMSIISPKSAVLVAMY